MKEIPMRAILTALALSLAMPMAAFSRDASEAERAATIPVTIAMAGQAHRFDVEVARTDAEQDRGLMFRTSLPEDKSEERSVGKEHVSKDRTRGSPHHI